jgi:hypothetical protein
MNSSYNKGIIMAATVLVIACSAIGGASGALGLTPTVAAWVSVIGGIVGTCLTVLVPNKNQPQLQPGQVVVNQAQIIPGTTPAVKHDPS